LEPDTPYYLMETLVSPEHPSWKYYSANLMHATDFISQSCLRSVMPDKDKQIRLKVRFEELAEAMDAIGVQDLSNLVLVHPGKGWPSKTFPSSWWSTTIERIAAKGFKIVVIGKYLSDEQGTVDVTLPDGAVDARNLLSLGALIALISQARVLVSNDSAPIHIAGAFDNHIILIPSCKHPDHVIPLRNGIRYYKAEALCKRLMVDDIDSTPTQVHGQTIDKVRGDILDYLPDSNTVAEAVAKAMAAGTEGTKQEPVI
jgi:ADP-heptose:LPS heptosyltransferase